jgi:hypothetical protein
LARPGTSKFLYKRKAVSENVCKAHPLGVAVNVAESMEESLALGLVRTEAGGEGTTVLPEGLEGREWLVVVGVQKSTASEGALLLFVEERAIAEEDSSAGRDMEAGGSPREQG